MNDIRRIGKNVSIEFIGRIISRILSFGLIVVLARELGASDFGVYSVALAFTTLFLTIGDFGTGQYFIREVARKPEDSVEDVNNIVLIRVVGSSALLALAIISGWLINYPREIFLMIVLIGSSKLIRNIAGVAQETATGFERMELSNAAEVGERIVTTIISILAVLSGFGLLYVGGAFILGSLAYAVIAVSGYVWITHNHGLLSEYSFDLDVARWKTILSESWPFMASRFFKFIYFDIDTLMISILLTQAAVGWYSGAYRLMTSVGFISTAIMSAVYPALSRFYESDDSGTLDIAFDRTLKYMIAISIPLGFGTTIVADDLVNVVYGPEYAESVLVLQILIWAEVVIFHNHLLGTVINSIDRQRYNTINIVVMAIINISINLVFIPLFGISGAAIATVITELSGAILAIYWVKKFYRMPNYQRIWGILAAAISMAVGVFMLDSIGISVFLLIPAGVIIYLVGVLLFGVVDETDIDLVRRALA